MFKDSGEADNDGRFKAKSIIKMSIKKEEEENTSIRYEHSPRNVSKFAWNFPGYGTR